MNAKRILAAIALICAVGFVSVAQDVPVFSVENGYSVGFDVNASNVGSSFDMTIGIGVSDKIQALVSFLPGDGSIYDQYRLFGLSYSIFSKLGVSMLYGRNVTDAAPVAGVGLYSDVFGRDVGGLSTAFRIKLDYLAKLSDYSDGLMRVGLAAVIGL